MRVAFALMMLALIMPLTAEAGIIRPKQADGALIIDGKTVLTISASEHMRVTQDRLSATLSIQKEGKEAAEVQEYINQKMREATKKAENTSGVKVSTGGYHVNRNYYDANQPRQFRWIGEQTLILDSANAEALLNLSGDIQKMGFATQDLSYYLSREKTESLRDELAARALETLKVRANAVAKQLGMAKVQFAQVNIGNESGDQPVVYGRAMRMEAMAAGDVATPPVAKADESDVSVTVQAVVMLSD